MDMKEKLVELLKEADRYEFEEQKKNGDFSIEAGWKLIADHLIANGVTVQEWISVKDRLPEAGKKVICCGSEGGLFVARTRECAGRVLIIDNKSAVQRKATHWMPLPPAPKGE